MSGYISVNRWRDFQHYDPAKRQPPWIKVYTRLHQDEDYLKLSAGERSILFGIWVEYASCQCRVSAEPSWLTRRLNLRVRKSHLFTLEQAGFITIVASASLAEGYQDASSSRTRVETEEDRDLHQEGLSSSNGSDESEQQSSSQQAATTARGSDPREDEYEATHPHVCSVCAVRKRTVDALEEHMLNVHEPREPIDEPPLTELEEMRERLAGLG